jgi:dolichol kinase
LKSSSTLKSELTRKGIHVLIAFVPFLASSIGRSHTALLMMVGILFYTCAESMRFLGFSPPLVSSVTGAVLRVREYGRFAGGPVTLGLGALLALLLFPPPIAAAAIYALAFGDSAATLVGRFIGRFRPAFLSGKSVEGSLACFTFSFLSAYLVLRDWKSALAMGIAAMITDALPLKDFDNLLLPLAAGIGAVVMR